MGKEDNIRFELLKQNRNERSGEKVSEKEGRNSKLMKEVVKLQFGSGEECNNFLKAVRENL